MKFELCFNDCIEFYVNIQKANHQSIEIIFKIELIFYIFGKFSTTKKNLTSHHINQAINLIELWRLNA